ncbi:MAG: hypothetical protein IT448_07385 [Phycisphaerales bacterium]|nr:hypothetical protein [Phycisphaerales bacterium]
MRSKKRLFSAGISLVAAFLGGLWAVPVQAGQVVVRLEGGQVQQGIAQNRSLKIQSPGVVQESEVRFSDLLPDTPYDLDLTLVDGRVLAGVDMSWYESLDQPEKPAEALNDDDRAEIDAIVRDVPSFYDRSELLKLAGNHDRAVGLVQLVRDRAFHASKSDEVIWRVELYYFQYQAGGWEKVQQQNKVLRRERFATRQQYENVVDHLDWVEKLGGIICHDDKPVRIELSTEELSRSRDQKENQQPSGG